MALVSWAMLLTGLGQGSAAANVTAVSGSAYGYSSDVTIFGMPAVTGPTPSVTLAPNASNSPQTATAPTGNASAGPATLFSSGPIAVSSQGALGAGGSVTGSTSFQNVNASGQEAFTASTLAGSCGASEAGVSGSTTITGGKLETDNGDSDPSNSIPDHPPVDVALPTNPAPNTTYNGHIHVGNTTDNFRYVFNEQVVSPAGSVTVNAAHEYLLGPTAVGDLIVGHSVCGVTGAPDTTPPETTITSGPSGTITINSASFQFSSTEAGSTFQCRLDGPGAAAGSFSSCGSPKTYTGLANGSYTFSVRATDVAGNTDPTPATRSFTVSRRPPPPPPPDVTPPVAKLGGSRSQKLGNSVRVRVSCLSEPCRAVAGGSVRVPRIGTRRARRYQLRKATAAIAKGRTATLRPKLSRAARRAINRALRRGRRTIVRLEVTLVDNAGNKRTLGRRIRLRL